MFKRALLFLSVNAIVIFSISLILNFLHITPYLTKNGIDYGILAAICLIWGFTGAFATLLLSRWMAKRVYSITLLDLNTRTPWERKILEQVYECSKKAGIRMPQVGVYNSDDINAFATGPSRNKSLVALSSGLINNFTTFEVEGVIAHEVSHIANGDMVTMTLIQGLVNSFVMFLSRALAHVIVTIFRRDNERINYTIFYITSFVLEMILMFVGSVFVAFYSRQREYRADRDGAKLVGKNKMLAALERIQQDGKVTKPANKQEAAFKNLQISSESTWMSILASHPSTSNRINRLRKM